MTNYLIEVCHDDVEKVCFMVCIKDEHGEVHGIPLRGVSKREAVDALKPLKYAFEYGATAALREVGRVSVSISEKTR